MTEDPAAQIEGGKGPIGIVSAPPARAVLLYDGDCGFCRRWVARWKYITGAAVDYEPYQQAASRFPELPGELFRRRMVLVLANGEAYSGPVAIFHAFNLAGRKRWLLRAYRDVPMVASITDAIYGVVTHNRPLLSRVDRFLLGRDLAPSTYFITREVFTRGLALVFLVAFASLWTQVHGLVGSHGILPIDQLFTRTAATKIGASVYWNYPTLVWLGPTDRMLDLLCGGGVALSVITLIGFFQGPALLLMWILYLSLSIAGQVFLGFQWDALLLEAGLLSIFFARWSWRPLPRIGAAPPAWLSLWMIRWLLFRLMFLSGVVKLTSHDPTWRGWTALNFHYWTQPLPTWTSWYVHQMPDSFKQMSVGVTLYIELLVPFLIFGTRRLRQLAFWQLLLLQLLIAATGNFGFFNLLSIVLCLTLLDDTSFTRWSCKLRTRVTQLREQWSTSDARTIRRRLAIPFAAFIILVSIIEGGSRAGLELFQSPSALKIAQSIQPLRSVSAYGLFASMTTSRPELIIEGSRDGQTWTPYPFRWKPVDPMRRPDFCTPHMPRLDWQMWFLALDKRDNLSWFLPFLRRLLEGDQVVLNLLERDPFEGKPPIYVRVIEYQYEFTDRATRNATGAWWKRDEGRTLVAPISLDMFNEAATDAER